MSKWPIEFTIFKKLTDWNIQWNYSIKMSDWIIFKIFNKLTEWIHNKIFLGQLMFAWLAGWSEKYSKWFSDFEKTNFLFPDLIGEILLRNSTIWVENHCIGIYGPLKSLHTSIVFVISKISGLLTETDRSSNLFVTLEEQEYFLLVDWAVWDVTLNLFATELCL